MNISDPDIIAYLVRTSDHTEIGVDTWWKIFGHQFIPIHVRITERIGLVGILLDNIVGIERTEWACIPVSDIRVSGRATQGVKVINLREGDSIASVIPVPKSDDEEQPVVEQSGVEAEATDVETTASSQTMNSSPALEE